MLYTKVKSKIIILNNFLPRDNAFDESELYFFDLKQDFRYVVSLYYIRS